METATHIPRTDHLDLIDGNATRVYFGNEFCQNLIPREEDVLAVLSAVREEQRSFTLVTPLVTDDGLDRLTTVLETLRREEPGSEVVVNDWGALTLVNDMGFEPVLGRLLNRLRRGPRITRVMERLPELTLRQYRENNLTVPALRRFLAERGVRRVEIDNLIQGLDLALGTEPDPLAGSLYHPYMAVSTTRLCPTANCDVEGPVRIGVWPCGRQCRDTSFTLTHPIMPGPLIVRGNTVFYRNDAVPDENELARMNIDRLVHQPVLPV